LFVERKKDGYIKREELWKGEEKETKAQNKN
jgi:hypothetical protein